MITQVGLISKKNQGDVKNSEPARPQLTAAQNQKLGENE